MTAKNFVFPNDKPANSPDAHFLLIYTGIKAFLTAYNLITTAAAANNQAYVMDIEKGVIDQIKDSVKKLQDTKRRANGVLVNQWLALALLILDPTSLALGTPVLWYSAMLLPNPSQLSQNSPVAIIPGAPDPQVQQLLHAHQHMLMGLLRAMAVH